MNDDPLTGENKKLLRGVQGAVFSKRAPWSPKAKKRQK
jgi:hypothetical protein